MHLAVGLAGSSTPRALAQALRQAVSAPIMTKPHIHSAMQLSGSHARQVVIPMFMRQKHLQMSSESDSHPAQRQSCSAKHFLLLLMGQSQLLTICTQNFMPGEMLTMVVALDES